MARFTNKPDHVESASIGFYPETDYDEFGEQALPTLCCTRCGARRKTGYFNQDTEFYEWIPQVRLEEFFDAHRNCQVVDGMLYSVYGGSYSVSELHASQEEPLEF